MAHSIRTVLFSVLALSALAGCPPATEDTDPATDTDDLPGTEVPAIEGMWLSENADVAPLLANPPLNIVSIDAEFMGDGSYTVTTTDMDGAMVDFLGTYTIDESSDPATIVLTQTTPTNATSEGIWDVDGGVLTYEVAQTSPEIPGVTAPTPAGGFGSTSGGALGMDNVQVFR